MTLESGTNLEHRTYRLDESGLDLHLFQPQPHLFSGKHFGQGTLFETEDKFTIDGHVLQISKPRPKEQEGRCGDILRILVLDHPEFLITALWCQDGNTTPETMVGAWENTRKTNIRYLFPETSKLSAYPDIALNQVTTSRFADDRLTHMANQIFINQVLDRTRNPGEFDRFTGEFPMISGTARSLLTKLYQAFTQPRTLLSSMNLSISPYLLNGPFHLGLVWFNKLAQKIIYASSTSHADIKGHRGIEIITNDNRNINRTLLVSLIPNPDANAPYDRHALQNLSPDQTADALQAKMNTVYHGALSSIPHDQHANPESTDPLIASYTPEPEITGLMPQIASYKFGCATDGINGTRDPNRPPLTYLQYLTLVKALNINPRIAKNRIYPNGQIADDTTMADLGLKKCAPGGN